MEPFDLHEVVRNILRTVKEESKMWRAAYHRRTDEMTRANELTEAYIGADIFEHAGEDDV